MKTYKEKKATIQRSRFGRTHKFYQNAFKLWKRPGGDASIVSIKLKGASSSTRATVTLAKMPWEDK